MLQLWCWVLVPTADKNAIFSVMVEPTMVVDDLRRTIKQSNEHTFRGVDHTMLKLWHVNRVNRSESMRIADVVRTLIGQRFDEKGVSKGRRRSEKAERLE